MNETGLPAIRNYRPGDEEKWLALLLASPDFVHDFFNRRPSLDVLRMVVGHPQMDALQHLFFADDGEHFVGYAELWSSRGLARAVGRILVHPDWRRRGLGTRLLDQVERRAGDEGSEYLDILVAAQAEAGCRFLEARDYHAVHYGWHMTLRDIDSVPPPQWPTGYATRIFIPGQDEGTSVEIENQSFQDEWEYTPIELGEIEGFVHSPAFQAEGVIYATHRGRVVGECWNWIDEGEISAQMEEKRGDVWCVCVHPQHRRQGLGRALLLAGVHWMREQGVTAAYLAVDGANERAKHLYESVGFVARRTDVWYRQDLSAQRRTVHNAGLRI